VDRGDVLTLGLGVALVAAIIAALVRWGPDGGSLVSIRSFYEELRAMGVPAIVAGPSTVLA
jgi:hypothetical protein